MRLQQYWILGVSCAKEPHPFRELSLRCLPIPARDTSIPARVLQYAEYWCLLTEDRPHSFLSSHFRCLAQGSHFHWWCVAERRNTLVVCSREEEHMRHCLILSFRLICLILVVERIYGVASISRIDKIIRLFCKRAL